MTHTFIDRPIFATVLSVFLTLIGLGALVMAFRGARLIALALSFAALAIFVPTLTLGVGPHLTQFWMSERLAAVAAKDAMPGDPSPALAGFEEPSLVFALNANVTLTDGVGAAKQGADQGGLALVDDHERSAFLAHLPGSFQGLHSKGTGGNNAKYLECLQKAGQDVAKVQACAKYL